MHVVSLASTCRKENEKNRAANGTRFRVQLHRDYERAILPIATQEMAALPDRRHLFSEKFLCHARNVAPLPLPPTLHPGMSRHAHKMSRSSRDPSPRCHA